MKTTTKPLSIDYFGIVPGANDTVAEYAQCKRYGHIMRPNPVWKLRLGINAHRGGPCPASKLSDFIIR